MRRLIVRSETLNTDLEEIKRDPEAVVVMNTALGFHESSLECLRRVPEVRKLEVVSDAMLDWSPLDSLENLTELLASTDAFRVDLSRFKELKQFFGPWHRDLNLDRCPSLRRLLLTGFDERSLSYFSGCTSLNLLLLKDGRYERVDLELPSLVVLRLWLSSRTVDLEGISGLRNLVVADFNQIRPKHFEEIAVLQELYDLALNGARSIASLRFLNSMPRLESFRCYGTKVLDGDLDPLVRLRWPGFDNARSYNHTRRELEPLARSRGGAVEFQLETEDRPRWLAEIRRRITEVADKNRVDVDMSALDLDR